MGFLSLIVFALFLIGNSLELASFKKALTLTLIKVGPFVLIEWALLAFFVNGYIPHLKSKPSVGAQELANLYQWVVWANMIIQPVGWSVWVFFYRKRRGSAKAV